MAQPPLSVQIRNLKAQIGTPLFLRESTGMRLTDTGSALFSRAREARRALTPSEHRRPPLRRLEDGS